MSVAADDIEVEVALDAGPRDVRLTRLRLPAGSTLRDAVAASGLLEGLHEPNRSDWQPAVWGRAQPWEQILRERDRVELAWSLQVDPKEARRLRYQRDGLKRPRPAPR